MQFTAAVSLPSGAVLAPVL